jgi:hypothetical protein
MDVEVANCFFSICGKLMICFSVPISAYFLSAYVNMPSGRAGKFLHQIRSPLGAVISKPNTKWQRSIFFQVATPLDFIFTSQ